MGERRVRERGWGEGKGGGEGGRRKQNGREEGGNLNN